MNYKDQTNEVKQIIIDLATEARYGDPQYTNLNEIDYKFWEDCSHEESVIILAQKLAKLNAKITELQKKSTIAEYRKWKIENPDEDYQYDEIYEFTSKLGRGEMISFFDYLSEF